MAFLSGSQVNPALGRTDFTPFLQGSMQGSQMAAQGAAAMGQGIAGLGAGIAQGVERFKQNKEQEKKMAGVIKVAEKMSAGFEPILEKVDPRIGKTLQELRMTISDPNLSTKERAAAASTFMEQAPNLLNAGLKFIDLNNEQAARMAKAQAVAPGFASPQEAVASVANQPVPAGYTVGYKAIDGGRYVPELVAAKDREDKGGFDTPDAALAAAQKLPVPEGQAPSFRVGAGGKYYPELVTKPVQQVPNPEEDQRVKIMGGVIQSDIDSGKIAQRIAPNFGRLERLLEAGELETGKFAEFKTNATAVIKGFGLPVDEKKLANQQEAVAYLGQAMLEHIQFTKGAISNKENDLFISFGPSMDKSPEANLRLVKAIRARLKLDRDLAKVAEDGVANKKSFSEMAAERRALIEKYDASLPSVGKDVSGLSESALNYLNLPKK